ncbi:MAG: endonuclease/exonuclease/phosphatase family protein [Saprospiraceae bacterium]|nr:endonuclease/exonuclease/phosphatase family protein [Saprospiraceae bacterium]
MKFFDRTILLFNLAAVVALLIAYVAPHIDPELTWALSFFGLFYPIILLINILFIFYWVFKKPRYIWPSLIAILFGWSQLNSFISFKSHQPESEGETISIMSFNISNGSFGYDKNKKTREIKKEGLIDFLDQFKNTDILCFQEVGDYAYEILKKNFPKHHIYFKQKGAVILSKYPFRDKGEIDFGTKTNSCLWADITLDEETFRVYSIHLQSNQITKDTEKLANQKELNQKQAWYDIKGILRKFRNKHLQRSRQAEKIEEHVKKSPYKVIMAGDLNDPPQSYTYKVFSLLGNDAFREKGAGIGTTFAGKIPLLRIDYIFADKNLKVHDFTIIKDNYSDHYPITTTLEWNGKIDDESSDKQ